MFKKNLIPATFFGKKAADLAIKVVKNTVAVVAITVMVGSLASCDKNDGPSNSFGNRSTVAADYPQSSLPVVAVNSDITGTAHWTAGNVYEIDGVVTVRSGGHLEIDPGTFIKAKASPTNPTGANGVLVVAKDGTIDAVGTSTNPIVFTSYELLDGDAATCGEPGQFGGVIILGDSYVNTPSGTSNIEGLPDTDPRYTYGGTDATDNRGNFQYVRIEYAGYELAPNIEVNGLTMGGVGSGTTINNVQVSWGLDDGFEWFGGTVSTSNLVAYANDDDQFDFDLGYQGTLSNSVAIANDCSTHSGLPGPSDSNGAEIDNNPNDNCGASPQTEVTFDNVSIWGTPTSTNAGDYENGVHVRRGATLFVESSTVTGYNTGIFVEASTGACEFADVSSSRIHGYNTVGNYSNSGGNTTSTADPAPWFPGSFAGSWVKFDYCGECD